MSNNNTQTVLDFQQAIGALFMGESPDVGQYLADDACWHLPPAAAQKTGCADYQGSEAILGMLTGDVSPFYKIETMRMEFHSTIAEGDYVHRHFTLIAETPQGRHYENRYQILYQLKAGKIQEVWESYDTAYQFALYD